MTFENVMQSAKQLRKMTKFHFLDQNLNLPPPPGPPTNSKRSYFGYFVQI